MSSKEVIVTDADCTKPGAPTISANNTVITGTGQAILTASSCSGTITWSTNVTGTSISVGLGTYTATCSNSCGSSEQSNAVSITNQLKLASPVITCTPSKSINLGDAVIISGSCAYSGTLVWTSSIGFTAGKNMPSETTTYKAKCVDSGILDCDEASLTVTVNCPTPTSASIVPIVSEGGVARTLLDGSTIKLGQSVTVNAVCSGNDVLHWNSPAGFTEGLYTLASVGNYSFSCTCQNACGKTSSIAKMDIRV